MTAPNYLDSHTLIVGASGAGKTVTAKVMAEQLLDEGRHTCIVDPTGAWHGLRTNAAGDAPGYAIPIFGGAKGDLPIRCSQGAAIGAIIAGGVTAILDLSEMDSDEQHEFMSGFLSALRKKPRANFHLVVDEADEFAAQTSPSKLGEAAKKKMEWIAKRGRVQGFVLTAITQRPADIAKSVISQMQTLVAHQMIAPADQAAVDGYLKANAPAGTRKEVMQSLAGLARGERWIYSPRLDVLERGISPMPATFDSSREPAPGESVHEPKMLAQIDLAAIREQLADEQDQQQEPEAAYDAGKAAGEALKQRDRRIAELEREREDWTIERAYGQQQLDAVIAERDELRRIASEFQANWARVSVALADEIPSSGGDIARPPRVEQTPVSRPKEPTPAVQSNGAGTAGETAPKRKLGAERKPLAALAAVYPSGLTEAQWATSAGLKRTGGTWSTYKSRLKTAELIEQRSDRWFATEQGAGAVGDVELPPPPGAGLVRWWADKLPGVGKVAEALIEAYPRWMSREELGERAELEPTGGTFSTYLSRLAGPELIARDRDRGVRLNPEMMG